MVCMALQKYVWFLGTYGTLAETDILSKQYDTGVR